MGKAYPTFPPSAESQGHMTIIWQFYFSFFFLFSFFYYDLAPSRLGGSHKPPQDYAGSPLKLSGLFPPSLPLKPYLLGDLASLKSSPVYLCSTNTWEPPPLKVVHPYLSFRNLLLCA